MHNMFDENAEHWKSLCLFPSLLGSRSLLVLNGQRQADTLAPSVKHTYLNRWRHGTSLGGRNCGLIPDRRPSEPARHNAVDDCVSF